MIRFETRWQGLDTLGEEELAALREPTEIAVMKTTLYFEGKVKRKLQAVPERTGRLYGDHRASAPGEPPAPISGNLRKTISHSEVKWDGDEAWAEVGTPMPYAKILEFGGIIHRVSSKGNSYIIRILPRPYFGATWLEEEAHMQAMLDKAVSTKAPVLVDLEAEVA